MLLYELEYIQNFFWKINLLSNVWGRGICGLGPLYIRAQGLGRGDLLLKTRNESPKKAQGCSRGRSHAQHPTGHLKKKDEFNAGTRQEKKLPIL